ncbi:MAG: hypothetical protein R3F14_41130 [Polyangiaceae bacterium]
MLYKKRVDVVVVGHAYPGSGAPVRTLEARHRDRLHRQDPGDRLRPPAAP